MDSREALVQGGDSGSAIVPYDADASLLLHAVQRSADVSPMPPAEEQALRADEVAALRDWIQAGAPWPETAADLTSASHWAFAPLRAVAPPDVQDTSWSHTFIDRFLRSRQAAEGATPAPPADRRTLIRRATFDLTGLPPTPAEVQAFLEDADPQAFAKVVERLLSSPAYGEKWGRHWLDVARYADTAGETADFPVPEAWRYRNYVIAAFNADKPYDQFVREQIAGDVLALQQPDATYAEKVVATGFLAVSRRFGFDSENYHHLTIQDTIDTVGQAILGLTLGCARCHDHKFDPVTMEDYYALYGIFDSSRYPFPGSEQKQRVRALAPLTPPSVAEPLWRDFEARVAALGTQLAARQQPVPSATLRSVHEMDGDFELQAPAAGGSYGVLVPPWHYEGSISVNADAQSPYRHVYPAGRVGASVAANAGAYRIYQALHPPVAAASRWFLSLDFRIAAAPSGPTAHHQLTVLDATGSPLAKLLLDAHTVLLAQPDGPLTLANLPQDGWRHLQLECDLEQGLLSGRCGTPDATSTFGPIALVGAVGRRAARVELACAAAEGLAQPAVLYDNLAITVSRCPPVATEEPPAAEPTAEDPGGELRRLLVEGPCDLAYAMAEGTPHDVPIQLRGEPSQAGGVVPRGFIKVLGGRPLPSGTVGSGRLELAEWLTRPDQPLTARVMVNRIWQHHFGRGLVATPNDFGVRGQPPTHPELLEALATEFIRSGWSIKSMHRTILSSAAWQQQSATDAQHAAWAGDADLYCGFRRRRLAAEEIRDALLAVSGELELTPGEGHPFPDPCDWSYTQHAPFGDAYDHRRRSVYLMTSRLKRSELSMLFDGPDPNASTAVRLGTTTPAQSLYFMNSPLMHQASVHWAERQILQQLSDRDCIAQIWETALSRPVDDDECAAAERFLARYREESTAVDERPPRQQALAALLRAVLSSNEFVHVD